MIIETSPAGLEVTGRVSTDDATGGVRVVLYGPDNVPLADLVGLQRLAILSVSILSDNPGDRAVLSMSTDDDGQRIIAGDMPIVQTFPKGLFLPPGQNLMLYTQNSEQVDVLITGVVQGLV